MQAEIALPARGSIVRPRLGVAERSPTLAADAWTRVGEITQVQGIYLPYAATGSSARSALSQSLRSFSSPSRMRLLAVPSGTSMRRAISSAVRPPQ